jgi:hypothetical protein
MHRIILPLLLAAAASLTACGSDDNDGRPSRAEMEDMALKFAQCMREHGIDMPDPQFEEGGRMTQRIGGPGQRIDPKRMEAAQEACREFQPKVDVDMSPEEEQELRDQILAHTQCMREHGIDMPDPQFEGGGRVIMRESRRRGGVNPESPAFRKADEACRDLMPQPGDDE